MISRAASSGAIEPRLRSLLQVRSDQLHGDIGLAAILARVEDREDTAVIQLGHRRTSSTKRSTSRREASRAGRISFRATRCSALTSPSRRAL